MENQISQRVHVKVCWKWLLVRCKLSLGDLIKKDQSWFLDKII